MKKTVVKTVGYRMLGATYGFAAGLVATGEWKVAAALVGTEAAYKMVMYFVYERAWEAKWLKAKFAAA